MLGRQSQTYADATCHVEFHEELETARKSCVAIRLYGLLKRAFKIKHSPITTHKTSLRLLKTQISCVVFKVKHSPDFVRGFQSLTLPSYHAQYVLDKLKKTSILRVAFINFAHGFQSLTLSFVNTFHAYLADSVIGF